MLTLNYHEDIAAPVMKVWDTIWNENTYRQWTKPFSENSQMKSDWKVGGKTLFTDGKGNGMISTLSSWNPPYEAEFEHRGELKDGIELMFSADHPYSGATEKYILTESNTGTRISALVETIEEFKDSMNTMFPAALKELKRLCEL